MIKIILGATALAYLFFKNSSDSKPAIGGIPKDRVYTDYMVEYKKNANLSTIKRQISKNLNFLIANCENFKLGKTGNGEERALGYKGFEDMYLLCESSNERYIDELEAHYIQMHIENPKNENERRGSAGKMGSKNGKYYLYVTTI
ncbi:MAG: hypothetical protein ACRBFS_21460 [Aureispira sp.]